MLCVVGKPKKWFIGKSKKGKFKSVIAPFPSNLVYLVFLSERMSIFEYGAELTDIEDPLSPTGWKNRFVERIWKKNS